MVGWCIFWELGRLGGFVDGDCGDYRGLTMTEERGGEGKRGYGDIEDVHTTRYYDL